MMLYEVCINSIPCGIVCNDKSLDVVIASVKKTNPKKWVDVCLFIDNEMEDITDDICEGRV